MAKALESEISNSGLIQCPLECPIYSLDIPFPVKEVARLNKQVIQMYKQGRYREAIRVVCQNTLSLALRDTDKKIVFKHVHQGNYTDLQN